MAKISLIFLFFLIFFKTAYSKEIIVFEFTKEEFKTLKIKKVKGETQWTLGKNEKGKFIQGKAQGTASALGIEKKINLLETPYINITWKVEKNLAGINEKSKKGHDYAARVFVIKKTGTTALSNRAINYVFSSNNNIDEYWRSPYTKRSIDYVLSTTQDSLDSLDNWITVKANVKKHFKKLHNLEVENINGLAIMTDTDNSKLSAIAYYQNIYFSSE